MIDGSSEDETQFDEARHTPVGVREEAFEAEETLVAADESREKDVIVVGDDEVFPEFPVQPSTSTGLTACLQYRCVCIHN